MQKTKPGVPGQPAWRKRAKMLSEAIDGGNKTNPALPSSNLMDQQRGILPPLDGEGSRVGCDKKQWIYAA
jgi:hypothetical protein